MVADTFYNDKCIFNYFNGIVLDPLLEQACMVYVSYSPATFARDAGYLSHFKGLECHA